MWGQLFASAQCPVRDWMEQEGGHRRWRVGIAFIQMTYRMLALTKKFNVVLQLVTSSTFILSDSWVSHFMPWWPLPGTAVWMWPLSLAQFDFWGAVKDWLLPHPVCGLLLLSKTNTEYNSLSCSKLGMPKEDIRCCILEIDTGNQYDSACGQNLRH